MACCKRVTPAPSQQNIVNKVAEVKGNPLFVNTGVKSNRSPAGTIARQCSNCGTKTISKICPVCSQLL